MESKPKYLLYGSEKNELFLEGDFGNHLSTKYYIDKNEFEHFNDYKPNIYFHLELEDIETNNFIISEFFIPSDALEKFKKYPPKDLSKYDWIKYVENSIKDGGKITLNKYNCPNIFIENPDEFNDYKWILLPFSVIDQIQDILCDDSKDDSIIIDKKLIDSSLISGHYRLLNAKYKKIIKVYKAFNIFLDNIKNVVNKTYFPETDLHYIENTPESYLPKPDDY